MQMIHQKHTDVLPWAEAKTARQSVSLLIAVQLCESTQEPKSAATWLKSFQEYYRTLFRSNKELPCMTHYSVLYKGNFKLQIDLTQL